MHWIFLVAMLFGLPVSAEPCSSPDACGLSPEVIPDFTLTDVNPNSPTFGTEVSRDSLIGEYLIIYFSQAT
jgi:hypothetical protein